MGELVQVIGIAPEHWSSLSSLRKGAACGPPLRALAVTVDRAQLELADVSARPRGT